MQPHPRRSYAADGVLYSKAPRHVAAEQLVPSMTLFTDEWGAPVGQEVRHKLPPSA